jgi:hypothetical protein
MEDIAVIPSEIIEKEYIIERNDTFIRKDLYQFMNFIYYNEIKRTHRDNTIPKGAAKKLAKILSLKDEMDFVESHGYGYWSDFISRLARGMKLVHFNTEGEYMGYSSRERSYPENYISLSEMEWKNYLALRDIEKEMALIKGLYGITENEFYHKSTLMNTEKFSTSGSDGGAASKMKLSEVRNNLLDILYRLKPGVWYSITDMVRYLKEKYFNLIINHNKTEDFEFTYFKLYGLNKKLSDKTYKLVKEKLGDKKFSHDHLIKTLKNFKLKNEEIEIILNYAEDKQNSIKINTYKYFYEDPWKRDKEIQDMETDSFERVEGRYVPFFLEEIPFIMGFVELAYHKTVSDLYPQPYGNMRAFRLTPKFFNVYGKNPLYNEVKVLVQANHEIVVEYHGYAEKEIDFLERYGKLKKDDAVLIFQLEKKYISDRVAAGEDIEKIIQDLKDISSVPLPENIITEMESWGSYGEKITLYRDYSLLEIEKGRQKDTGEPEEIFRKKIIKKISPDIYLVKDGRYLFNYLENHEYLPVEFDHFKKAFNYKDKNYSAIKGAPSKKPKIECEVTFRDFACFNCSKSKILSHLEEELKKKEIPSYLIKEHNFVLVPAVYKELLRNTARKIIEKNNMEIKEV